MDQIELMLKELTEASGVSGFEEEVRAIIYRYLYPLGDIDHDNLGSLICEEKVETRPRVALVAHMDEIGFMVKYITEEGFIRFTNLGGWWSQVLLAQRVVIQTQKGNIPGIIGAKPLHLMNRKERKRLVRRFDMYIDIGASSQAEVEKAGVRIGDAIVPCMDFNIMSIPGTYLAKAFDNRISNALEIVAMQKLLAEPHPNRIIAVATVQEEVGARGAATSVNVAKPDVAIILEIGIAGDIPGAKPEESAVKLGGGPVMLVRDEEMIPNLQLRDLAIETAEKIGVKLQLCVWEHGYTDGYKYHPYERGVPCIVFGVPVRYVHSHGSILRRDDFDNTVKLLVALVKKLDQNTVDGLTGLPIDILGR